MVAPDHCLTGLAKGVLQTCFQQLPNDSYRFKLDKFICRLLQEMGLSSESSIYSLKYKKIHSISMSYVYSVLSVLPFALESLNLNAQPPTTKLINILRQLVILTFWWPSEHVDGKDAMEYIHGSRRSDYYKDLRKLARDYVTELELFCQQHPQYIKNVDRPNVHRMLELYYMHTVVVFGHASFISDMLFEAAHQPLKFSISKNTSKNAHIVAVHHALLRDWVTRLLELLRLKLKDDMKVKEQATRNLRYLMFGSSANIIEKSNPQDSFLKFLDDHIDRSLDGAVYNMIENWYGEDIRAGCDSIGVWKGFSPYSVVKENDDQLLKSAFSFGKDILSRMYVDNFDNVNLYSKAIFKRSGTKKAL